MGVLDGVTLGVTSGTCGEAQEVMVNIRRMSRGIDLRMGLFSEYPVILVVNG